jgi:hypothetical protein
MVTKASRKPPSTTLWRRWKRGKMLKIWEASTLRNVFEKGVGPTAEEHPQTGLREGLREVAGALRNVHSNRRELCGEILKNKFPYNINCLVFINSFQYSLEHTSYIHSQLSEQFLGSQAGYRTTFRYAGSYQKAGISSMKTVSGRNFTINKR